MNPIKSFKFISKDNRTSQLFYKHLFPKFNNFNYTSLSNFPNKHFYWHFSMIIFLLKINSIWSIKIDWPNLAIFSCFCGTRTSTLNKQVVIEASASSSTNTASKLKSQLLRAWLLANTNSATRHKKQRDAYQMSFCKWDKSVSAKHDRSTVLHLFVGNLIKMANTFNSSSPLH